MNHSGTGEQETADSGLFSSLINRFVSSSTTLNTKWTITFTRLVDRCNATAKLDQLLPQLVFIEENWLNPALVGSKFENPSTSAQMDLLSLWECALRCALNHKTSIHKRAIPLQTIYLVMIRDDFSLKTERVEAVKRRYNKLLVATFDLATWLLRNSTSQDDLNFCAQSLSVFLFRLPFCSTLVVSAMEAKQTEETKRNSTKKFSHSNNSTSSQTRRSPQFTPLLSLPVSTVQHDQFVSQHPDLFLWASCFDKETGQIVDLVKEHSSLWTKTLISKEAFFLRFVEALVLHVAAVCGNVNVHDQRQRIHPIVWDAVPAYFLVLTSFIHLLRSAIWWDSVSKRTPGQGMGWVTSLAGYGKVRKCALAVLQTNRELLDYFLLTTFECTNANSLFSADSGVEHLQLFLSSVLITDSVVTPPVRRRSNAPLYQLVLPPCFTLALFWPHFAVLLQSEAYQVLLKACSFLYNTMDWFVGNHRIGLIHELLQPQVFWRLFLHWSAEVRTCFHHLVVYKVLRADRRFLPCFSDSQVMLLYGVNKKQIPVSSKRIETSAKAAWGGNIQAGTVQQQEWKEAATAEEVAQLTKSAQRRMAIFDKEVDDEELCFDMAVSSKIDSYVRMALAFQEHDAGGVPRHLNVYVEPALRQYSLLLIRYYRGATLSSLDDIPVSLSHRMIESEFVGGGSAPM